MKTLIAIINGLALVTLAVLSIIGPKIADLQVRHRLTDLDRNQCFNDEKVKALSHLGIDDPRGTGMSEFLTGSWNSFFTSLAFISILTSLLTLLLLLVPLKPSTPQSTPT